MEYSISIAGDFQACTSHHPIPHDQRIALHRLPSFHAARKKFPSHVLPPGSCTYPEPGQSHRYHRHYIPYGHHHAVVSSTHHSGPSRSAIVRAYLLVMNYYHWGHRYRLFHGWSSSSGCPLRVCGIATPYPHLHAWKGSASNPPGWNYPWQPQEMCKFPSRQRMHCRYWTSPDNRPQTG